MVAGLVGRLLSEVAIMQLKAGNPTQKFTDLMIVKIWLRVLAALLSQWKDAANPLTGLKYTAHVRHHAYRLSNACLLPIDYAQNRLELPPSLNMDLYNRLLQHIHFETFRDMIMKYAEEVERLWSKISHFLSSWAS